MESYMVKIKRDRYEYDPSNQDSVLEIGSYAIEDFIYEDLNPLLEQDEYKEFKSCVSIKDPLPQLACLVVTCPKKVAEKISMLPNISYCSVKP